MYAQLDGNDTAQPAAVRWLVRWLVLCSLLFAANGIPAEGVGAGGKKIGTDFLLSGIPSACSGMDFNGEWLAQGATASGRPWYRHKIPKSDSRFTYMYYDPDCAWDDVEMKGGFGPAWIISDTAPNIDVGFNLSGKKDCSNLAHTVVETKTSRPPSVVQWDIVCWSAGMVHSSTVRRRIGISDRPFIHLPPEVIE